MNLSNIAPTSKMDLAAPNYAAWSRCAAVDVSGAALSGLPQCDPGLGAWLFDGLSAFRRFCNTSRKRPPLRSAVLSIAPADGSVGSTAEVIAADATIMILSLGPDEQAACQLSAVISR